MRKVTVEHIVAYLKESGPISQRELARGMGVNGSTISRKVLAGADHIERFRFMKGQGKRVPGLGAEDLYGELFTMGICLAARDDPRIVPFIAERVPFIPKTGSQAGALYGGLRRHIGKRRAREVVKLKGYKYGVTTLRSDRPRQRARSVSDERFIQAMLKQVSDEELSKETGLTLNTVRNRRLRLGLKRRRRG